MYNSNKETARLKEINARWWPNQYKDTEFSKDKFDKFMRINSRVKNHKYRTVEEALAFIEENIRKTHNS